MLQKLRVNHKSRHKLNLRYFKFLLKGNEETPESSNLASNEMQQSQPIFPTSVSSAVLCLIDLLFDHALNYNNQSVSALAHRVIWTCLTEDATLFLRYFFEKITQREKKSILIQYLKKLINYYVDLPSQTAYVIFNYLVTGKFLFKFLEITFYSLHRL